jgi:hypothetical protein
MADQTGRERALMAAAHILSTANMQIWEYRGKEIVDNLGPEIEHQFDELHALLGRMTATVAAEQAQLSAAASTRPALLSPDGAGREET